MICDVAVLGMGLAGMCAALAAREAGARVTLAGAGPGTLHLASGCIDVMAYPPGQPAGCAPVANPLETVARVAACAPSHPYAIVGNEAVGAALPWLAGHATSGGWPIEGTGASNHRILTAIGRFRTTCLVPRSYLAGADLTVRRPIVLIGIAGLRDFSAPMLASALGARGHAVRCEILENLPTGYQGHALGLARYMRVGGAVEVGERIRAVARPGEVAGIPPILPPVADARFFEQMRGAAGMDLFEIPTLPPSLAGIRLAKALRARCLAVGVDIVEGVRAVGFGAAGGRVTRLDLAAGPALRAIEARGFVLATGSYLSGGLKTDREGVWEPLFGLPVERDEREPLFSVEFMGPAGHPAGKLGVRVDERLRPLGACRGAPAWENLFAAGDVLAGHNPIVERCGGGVAATTGRIAGQNAARAAAAGQGTGEGHDAGQG